mmetsp:Transcript_49762/g.115481  ORF Transcript_49762/g.115481 Transcript_49762/m.115481 type:complete len:224 (-) Transcript_49762:272-943(-)
MCLHNNWHSSRCGHCNASGHTRNLARCLASHHHFSSFLVFITAQITIRAAGTSLRPWLLLLRFLLLGLCLLLCLLHLQQLLRYGVALGSHQSWVHFTHKRNAVLVHGHTFRARNQDVLRLQVCVDNSADTVQVVKTDERVPCHLAHDLQRYTLEVVSLDQRKYVRTHGLEDHANVLAIRPVVLKVVNQLDNTCEGHGRQQIPQWPTLRGVPLTQPTTLGGFCQ